MKWRRSDSCDSDSVELMTPLTTPTPSLVKTGFKGGPLFFCKGVWEGGGVWVCNLFNNILFLHKLLPVKK